MFLTTSVQLLLLLLLLLLMLMVVVLLVLLPLKQTCRRSTITLQLPKRAACGRNYHRSRDRLAPRDFASPAVLSTVLNVFVYVMRVMSRDGNVDHVAGAAIA